MKWFGPAPFGPVCETTERTSTPADPCAYCDERFTALDCGVVLPGIGDGMPYHQDCLLRMVVGSIGHQMKLCPCYGGNVGDPEGLSRREAARAAVLHFHRNYQNSPITIGPKDQDQAALADYHKRQTNCE